MKLKDHITKLASLGRHYFTIDETQNALGISKAATWAALQRLQSKGEICSPYRGFYLIIPPEYRSLGCLPPEQFIPDLMQFLGLQYYVGLLTAAQYYGAGHQQTQVFQVMVEKSRRPIVCGKINIQFIAKRHLKVSPVNTFNTPKGMLRVGSPEVIALDLVAYPHQSGGLTHITTVLTELAEKLNPQILISMATSNELIPIFQRLGYLLEQIEDAKVLANQLWNALHKQFKRITPLLARVPMKGAIRDKRWKIAINTEIESDL